MARFGQGFIQSLTQPSYGQGLFNLGQQLGSAPTRRMEQQEQSKAMTMVNDALASQDPQKLLAAAQAIQQIDPQTATKLSQAAGQLNTQRKQAGVEQLEQGGQEITAQAQKSRAVQMALQRGDKESAQAIRSGLMDPKNYVSGILAPSGSGVTSSRSAGQYKDSENNIYEVDIQRTSRGSQRKYIPVSPNAPETPVGKITPVGGQFRETAGESTQRQADVAGSKAEAGEFGKLRVQAAEELPTLLSQKNDIDMAMASLDSISTAGIPAQVENYLRKATGGQNPDVANYELLVGEAMFKRLKPLFGGVISEGEREAVVSLYANLKRGNPANRSILQQMKRKLDESVEKANLIRSSENLEEYNLKLDKFFPTPTEETENVQPKTYTYNIETGELEEQ